MTCVSPPELDDGELLAYLDGEGEPWVIAHLAQCPHCRERAELLTLLQNRLTTRLYRVTCPSTVELGEYHLGVLSDDRTAAVAQHLAECSLCTREIAQLKGYLAELAPTLKTSVVERIKEQGRVLIARLVSTRPEGGLLGQPSPVLAGTGIRGEEGANVYQGDDAQVVVEIQDDAERPGRKTILGLVIGVELGELEAHLWQASQRVAVVAVDELGNFVIPDLAPGDYELILSGPEIEIHLQELRANK